MDAKVYVTGTPLVVVYAGFVCFHGYTKPYSVFERDAIASGMVITVADPEGSDRVMTILDGVWLPEHELSDPRVRALMSDENYAHLLNAAREIVKILNTTNDICICYISC